MRTSKRSSILDAAITLIQRDGVAAITYDAIAAESGLTRGGLLYHFPSREALLQAIHAHLAQRWETEMEQAAGGSADALDVDQRHAAYALASTKGSTRAELLMMLEGASDDALAAPWREVAERWAPLPPDDPDDHAGLVRYIARLASDGLWLQSSMPDSPLPDALRRRLAEHLAGVLRGDHE